MHRALADLVGADVVRPFPGVVRDAVVARDGRTVMSAARRVIELGPDRGSWPAPSAGHDVVFAPLGHLTRAGVDEGVIAELVGFVRPGGLLVTEELAAPHRYDPVVEPTHLTDDEAVLASVRWRAGGFDVGVTRFCDGSATTVVGRVVPPSTVGLDASLGRIGFELVGRWASWDGAPADGASWHVAVHRARSGAHDPVSWKIAP